MALPSGAGGGPRWLPSIPLHNTGDVNADTMAMETQVHHVLALSIVP
jgi:hypothetical protein